MPLPTRPLSVIVPVVTTTVGRMDRGHDVLGTAFLVKPELFMSANHVFGVTPDPGQTLAVVLMEGDELRALPATVIYSDADRDIAIARVEGWPTTDYLTIRDSDALVMNDNVLTIEYSPSEIGVPMLGGALAIRITANWHKGNVVRQYKSDFGRGGNVGCIDLSYPALKRASGAPVIHEASGQVLGMIIANVERQLMRGQLERLEWKDGTKEELIRYFLPSAKAIQCPYLFKALADCSG